MLSIVLEHTGMMDKNALKSTQEDFWLVRLAKKIGIRPQFLALQADTYLFIIYVGIILNQLMSILWFFMIMMNLYWIAIVILVFIKKGKEGEEKGKGKKLEKCKKEKIKESEEKKVIKNISEEK